MSKSSTDLRGAGVAGATTTSFGPLGSPFRGVADGVKVAVRLTPKAAHNRVQGLVAGADGTLALKIGVTAAPERGKANDALIDLLAQSWGVAKRDLSLVAGAADRHKTLHLAGEPGALLRRLSAWLDRTDLESRAIRG
jgi:uncharacterized protein (TIGR00251 family)